MKRTVIALVLILALCLSACGSKEKTADLTVIGAEDLTRKIVAPQYALTPESYAESAWIGAEMTRHGNTVYYLASDEQSELVCSLNLDTMERQDYYRDEALSLQDIASAEDGRLFLLAESDSAENSCLVVCLNETGAELFRAPLPLEDRETARAVELLNGQMFLLAGSCLIIYDDSGELKESKRIEVGSTARMAVTGSGTLILLQSRESGDTISVWNGEKKEPETVVSYDLSFDRVSGGTAWDLYLDCRGALFGYRLADGALEKLFSWNALGLNSGAVLELEDGRLVTNSRTGYNQKSPLRILRHREDTGEESSVIRFATTGEFMDSRIRAAIQTWNGEHPECPIEVIDYSIYNTRDDQRPGQLRLATDVASGNAPDIYDFSLEFMNSAPSAPSFARRGLLEDLYPYLDADPELKREDFLGGFLQAMEISGGLYELTPEFQIITSFADGRDIGDPSQWTFSNLNDVVRQKERYRYLFDQYMDREWWLANALAASDSKLVDWTNCSCNFETDYFRGLLEAAKQMPENGTGGDGTVYVAQSEGLLYYMPIDLIWWANMGYDSYGEYCCFVGIPELGNIIYPQHSYAISSLSSHKQECWEFLRQFWTAHYERQFSFSPRRESIRHQLEQQKEQAVKDGSDKSHPLFLQAMEDFYSVMDRVNITARYDPQIWEIVWQEANAYFSGGRNVEDAMRNIQSRVSIYLAEQG